MSEGVSVSLNWARRAIPVCVSIDVLICDDHPLFRQGLRRLLETTHGFRVVGEAERTDEMLGLLGDLQPDVVLLDLELPGSSGIAALEALRGRAPTLHVLVVSGFGDPARVRDALRAGAHGYVLKNAPPEEIVEAVRRVAAGRPVLDPRLAEAVATILRGDPEEDSLRRRVETLTAREAEVLRLAAGGANNAEIAKQLFISEGTVKNHMTSVLQKLDVPDRTNAAILAVKRGLVG